jgi:hypothetical protein
MNWSLHAMKVYRGSGGIALLIRKYGARRRLVVNLMLWSLYCLGKNLGINE